MTQKNGESLPGARHAGWRRAALLTLLTLALAALASSDAVHAALTGALTAGDAVIAAHPLAGALLFVAFAAVSAMLAFVSIAVLLPVAVFTWGEPLCILLLWMGWILGGAFSYALGRFLGRTAVRWFTAEALLHRLEERVGPAAPFGLVLLFQLALPSEIPGVVLGLVRYSFPRYLLALALVELLYTVVTVQLGASFLERRVGVVLAMGAAAALFSAGAYYLLHRKMR
jgi:uncharacterized membrane protein YdjX (TVP38/TMEM64 family)